MDRHQDSAQISRLEVVETGRRRHWTEDEKLKIVIESLQGARQVSATARRHGISRSLLLKWRRSFGPSRRVALNKLALSRRWSPQNWECRYLCRSSCLAAAQLKSSLRLGHGCGLPASWIRPRSPRRSPRSRMGGGDDPSSLWCQVWLAVGRTDMRRGMNGLALQVQETLGRDPHAGDLYVFRGARGNLIKILWHDGLGISLYAKRLERGRFIWPSPADGSIAISASQLAYMLDGIDWRNAQLTWRPSSAG